MKKKIYISYAKDSPGRQDKVHASLRPLFRNLKSQPYDKFDLNTLHLEIEIEVPDEMFKFKKIEVTSQKIMNS